MDKLINFIIILIGAFLMACIIFKENLSCEVSGWIGAVGFIFILLGWIYNLITTLEYS